LSYLLAQSLIFKVFQARLQSSITKYKEGINIKVINDANRIPKPIETAIGIKIRAWREVSNIIGAKPKNVVKVVNIIGLKR
jgi:hypothetical protein